MLNLEEIATICGGKLEGDPSVQVEHLLIDSRKSHIAKHSAFFAISGQIHDGHLFVSELIKKGVKVFILERRLSTELSGLNVLYVPNVLVALQKLAAYKRKEFKKPLVAITGSNGKTIVKEWCYQLFHLQTNLVRSPRSYNSQVGVPLSLWQLSDRYDLAIIEAGISTVGEMEKLEQMIQPDIGIITNIGDAHSAGFINLTEKIHEKLELFKGSKKLIYRSNVGQLSDTVELFGEEHPEIELVAWSSEPGENIWAEDLGSEQGKTSTVLHYKGKKYSFDIPFIDDASIENAIHSIILGFELGLEKESLIASMPNLHAIEMRLNQKEGVNNCTVISDFYNSDLRSLEIALEWMDLQHKSDKKTVILSDILQSELSPKQLYGKINELLQNYHVDRFIGIGPDLLAHQDLFELDDVRFYGYTKDLISHWRENRFHSETILLKGARTFEFEALESLLEKQTHRTFLDINLNALGHNLNYFKSLLQPNTKMMAMIKAFGYGSGGHEIARFLSFSGIDYLAVAYADEGVQLREDGIRSPVMVMNPDANAFATMFKYDLEPEIYHISLLKEYIRAAESNGITRARIHIELNTGMNRLGFDEEDLDDLILMLQKNEQIIVQSIFSHLTSSDLSNHDQHSKAQFERFEKMYGLLSSALQIEPIRHVLNSSGITRFPSNQYDMVRLGIGLYGTDPSGKASKHLKNIGTLKSVISQIRTIAPGVPIGYGRHSMANHERKIAVVAIGYADGLNRLMSQGRGHFIIDDRMAPIVGNVCMDMTMCDVTDIECKVGDEVIIFGENPTITQLAQWCNTIPYEILTSVSQRVKRVYSRE